VASYIQICVYITVRNKCHQNGATFYEGYLQFLIQKYHKLSNYTASSDNYE